MTLTEALKQGDLVRRKAWPWWQCLNNVKHDAKRVWIILERPALNGWTTDIRWEDAIADDWVVVKEIP